MISETPVTGGARLALFREKDVQVRLALWLSIGVCVAVFVTRILPMWSVHSIWDDAFMFVRYADNVLHHGRIAWNPTGEPSYGLTSILYLTIVIPLRLLFPGSSALAIFLASLISGVAFLVSLMLLVWRATDAGPLVRLTIVVFTLTVLASSNALANHFITGMDTTFVMTFLTIYLLIIQWHRSTPTATSTGVMGVWGGLAFFARPDLMLFSTIVPGLMLIFAPDRNARLRMAVVIAITLLTLAVQIGAAWVYFQSPLPLSFYVKQAGFYSRIAEIFQPLPGFYLGGFISTYMPFLVIIIASFLIAFKRWWSRNNSVEFGLFIATVLFTLYYLLGVVQIMPYQQRFYHPVLPAIAFVSVRSLGWLIEQLPPSLRHSLHDIPGASGFAVPVILTVALFIGLFPLNPVGEAHPVNEGGFPPGQFDVAEDYRGEWKGLWYALDRFSGLSNDVSIASTEIGLPGVMNPDKTIIDLAGLNERDFAHHGFSADVLFQKYKPDIIYMPSPDYYPEIRQAIRANVYFHTHYEGYSPERLNASMAVFIRKDSPAYPALHAILAASGN